MKHLFSLTFSLSILGAVAPAVGQTKASLGPPPGHRRLLTDQEEDGTVWVRGESYKLRVGADGTALFPREPRSGAARALRFGDVELSLGDRSVLLPKAARPRLEGARIELERGPLTEVLDLRPEGVRQSFVLWERPPLGTDLVLRVPLAGEVVFERDGEQGLCFRSPGGAEVRYGDVVAFDALGAWQPSASRYVDGAIELRVSSAFVAVARFPLVVDPFVSALSVDTGSDDPLNADCAADDSTNIVLYVMEDTFASGDRDIISRRFDQAGTFLEEVAVDITNDDTITPAVANYEAINQFLQVWTNTGSGLFNPRRIEGRTRAATTTSQGNERNFSFGQGEESDPDVGGPRTGTTAQYYVVWSERSTFSATNIRGRGMRADGSLATADIFDFPGDQTRPVINKSTTATGRYLIVYQQPGASGLHLRAQSMFANGDVEGNLGVISGTGAAAADVAGEQDRFLVVYEKFNTPTQADIVGVRVTFEFGEPASGEIVLSAQEPFGDASRHQFSPAVAVTAHGFVYMYAEAPTPQQFDSNIFAAAVGPDVVNVTFLEGHVPMLPAGPGTDARVRIASFPSGLRAFPAWNHVDATGDSDVRGALYETP